MHDGSLATLEDVVSYYDRGGNPNPGLDEELRPLHLTAEEQRALVSFLKSLSGTIREGKLWMRCPSGRVVPAQRIALRGANRATGWCCGYQSTGNDLNTFRIDQTF